MKSIALIKRYAITEYEHVRKRKSPWFIVFYWPWWIGEFRGFTLGPVVFLKRGAGVDVLVHEMVHVSQFYRQPLTFFARYLWELAWEGYQNNKYEMEARRVQDCVVALRTINVPRE